MIWFPLIKALPLKHHYHHLIIQFLKLNQTNLLRQVDDQTNLMNSEKFYVFQEESYEFIMTRSPIKRRYFKKFIKLFFWSGELDL